MRTTITLDDDVAVRLERLQRDERLSFKEAVNRTLREGLNRSAPSAGRPMEYPTFRMGLKPGINLDRALALAAELEDREIAEKLARRK